MEEPDGVTPPPDANMIVIVLFVCFLKINLIIPPPPRNLFFYIWIWVCWAWFPVFYFVFVFWLFGCDVAGPGGHKAREGRTLPGSPGSTFWLWLGHCFSLGLHPTELQGPSVLRLSTGQRTADPTSFPICTTMRWVARYPFSANVHPSYQYLWPCLCLHQAPAGVEGGEDTYWPSLRNLAGAVTHRAQTLWEARQT